MGASASVNTSSSSPREGPQQPMDGTDVALFGAMAREYDQMMSDNLADEVMFERMKHVRG